MGNKWITFDLDGTLMQNPFGEWVFPEIDQIARKYIGDGEQIFSELVQEHRMRMSVGLIVEAYDWDDIVGKVFINRGIPVEVNVEELVKKHLDPSKIYLLEDGLLEVLSGLKEQGFCLAAVTNGFEKYQKPVMDVLGLLEHFDKVITPEKVGYGKPRVEMVKDLLETGDVITAHVGDRLDHDVVFANNLGTLSVLVYRNLPDVVVTTNPTRRYEIKKFKDLVSKKWEKETGDTVLPSNAIPKVVIQSIKELSLLITS